MRKFFTTLACVCLASWSAHADLQEENFGYGTPPSESASDPRVTRAQAIALDTEDPLWFAQQADFLFRTTASYGRNQRDDILRASQSVTAGVNNRLNIFADIKYQQNFDWPEDGFSGLGFGLAYRFNDGPFMSDVFGGLELRGNRHVPEFATNTWFGGVKIGRQWSWATLAATAKSSWIFDENQGMAYLNFMPEAYFRLTGTVSLGIYSDLQKSTTPSFDREWLGGKFSIRYGRTVYTGFVAYEFELDEWRGGGRLNLLF